MPLTEQPAVPLRDWDDLRQQLGRIVRQHAALVAALDTLLAKMRAHQMSGVLSHRDAAVRRDERMVWMTELAAEVEKYR
jgi:hypothetical protein